MTTPKNPSLVDVRRRLAAILAALLVVVVVVVVNVVYVGHVQDQAERRDVVIRHESDRRWCDLLGLYVTSYRDNPPATELGREVAIKIEALWREFGCASK